MKNYFLGKYNTPSSLVVIGSYPKKGDLYGTNGGGISSFTKNTILALGKQHPNQKIVVLTMTIDKEDVYEEDNMLIVRCFKRNSPLSYFGLLKNILKFNRVKNVLIEFEFASFGDAFATSLFSLVIWSLKFLRKNTTLVLHQVIFNLKELSGHIGVSNYDLKMSILNQLMKLFFRFITLPVTKIVVLEEEFKQRLSQIVKADKIVFIPHGIDTNLKIEAKNKVKDEFTILYFGYLTWYKGVDFLVKTLKNVPQINGKKINLIIAGGASFTQSKKPHYQKFLGKFKKSLKGATNIKWTGFVPEEKIAEIFNQSDLVILPYRVFMSSSGPLSLAISYNKPFLLSENLKLLLHSSDFNSALNKTNLNYQNLVFKLNRIDLISSIANSIEQQKQSKMIKLSKILREKRSFDNIARIYQETITTAPRPSFSYKSNFLPLAFIRKARLFLS